MPFIPDTIFGIAYALAFAVTFFLVLRRGDQRLRALAWLFLAHWISLRAIAAYDHQNTLLWVFHDVATVVCLGTMGNLLRSRHAMACASLFFGVALFDQWWLIFGGSFEANAVVAEIAGYLCFLIMAGATIGHSGGNGDSRHHRWLDFNFSVEGGSDVARHAHLFSPVTSQNETRIQKNSGA